MEREIKENEELLIKPCEDCGGRMFSASKGVVVYCEEAWYNPYSDCSNILASG